jgi:hypothetical protein
VTRGRLQATHVARRKAPAMRRVSGGGKHPDCRDGTPLRGGSRDGDLGRRSHAEGTPAFRGHDCPTTTGCSTRFGGGERQPLSHGLPRDSDDVPSLRADRPTLAYSHGLTHPRRNRRWTRDAASHAAPRGAVAFRAPSTGRLAPVRKTARMVRCGSLPAVPRKGDSCRTPRASRESRGKRRQTQRPGLSTKSPSAGAGEDRTLEVVLARHSRRCRSRQTVSDAEKRTLSTSPDLEAFRDGRLARGPRAKARWPQAKKRWHPVGAEPHVTAFDIGCDPRRAREVGDGRHPGPSW